MRAMSMRRCAESGTTGLVDDVVRIHAEIYAEPKFGADPYFADQAFQRLDVVGKPPFVQAELVQQGAAFA